MTDILDLPGWKATETRRDGDEYEIHAEYTVQPDACQKCGVIGGLYRHGPKPIYIRDSPIRGRPVRILANAQRYKCRECGGAFIQPLGGVYPDTRMTSQAKAHESLMEALGNRCESCGGVFEAPTLEAHHIRPIVRGEHPKAVYVCPACHARFHTKGASHHDSDSTR